MNFSLSGKPDINAVGNFAGWSVTFFSAKDGKIDKEIKTFDSNNYDGDFTARLPSGLEGGAYTLVFEGISDEDFARLSKDARIAHLFLFWRDLSSISLANYVANSLGLSSVPKSEGKKAPGFVAELAVMPPSRRIGSRYYETVIEARELVYDYLAKTKLRDDNIAKLGNDALSAYEIVEKLGEKLVQMHKSPELKAVKDTHRGNLHAEKQSLLDAFQGLGTIMDQASPWGGRGLYLIRDGILHVGFRPIPFNGEGKEKELTPATGLIDAQRTERKDPATNAQNRFRLTLKGRSDIKPGDVVKFDPPKEESITDAKATGGLLGDIVAAPLVEGLIGGLSEKPTSLYIETVEHRLGRTLGFTTTITGVVIDGTLVKDAWDKKAIGESSAQQAPGGSDGRAARSINDRVRSSKDKLSLTEVGQIRRFTAKGEGETPAQTLTVWRGLKANDGKGNASRRLEVATPSLSPATGVAYMTLFAWGKTGLVLPYYPGTRAVVTHRQGELDDPLVMGALWENPPDSKPGDWWLSLPVGVPEKERSTLNDKQKPTPPDNLKATHDLIDAEGNRVIEVGEYILRVGRDSLKTAGERPQRPDTKDSITIEHVDGKCQIVLNKDGKIIIKAKNIQIEAEENVDVKANKVNFNVSDSVNIE